MLTPVIGEILIRGNAVTTGYYKRPDLNEDPSVFTADGWFRTGDVGQWNEDGTMSIIDRVKNLVKLSGGEVSFHSGFSVSRMLKHARSISLSNVWRPSIEPRPWLPTLVCTPLPMLNNQPSSYSLTRFISEMRSKHPTSRTSHQRTATCISCATPQL